MSLRLLSVAAAVFLLGACSDGYGTGSGSCTPSATQICMQGSAFAPAVDTVSLNAIVNFKNADGFTHSTTSSSVPATAAGWNTQVSSGAATVHQFTVVGTYEYYCTFHGSPGAGMHGRIVVQ